MLRRLTSLLPVFRYHRGFNRVMDIDEARNILDIEHSGSSVMERYRRLMKINHPDRGGSPYIASKINEAKNILVNARKPRG